MPFKKGQSGNPAGRKPGTKNRKIELLRSNDLRLQKKVLRMALDGDVVALRICADRLWPKIRPEALPVKVESKSSDLASQGAAVIDAALAGKLTPDVLRDRPDSHTAGPGDRPVAQPPGVLQAQNLA